MSLDGYGLIEHHQALKVCLGIETLWHQRRSYTTVRLDVTQCLALLALLSYCVWQRAIKMISMKSFYECCNSNDRAGWYRVTILVLGGTKAHFPMLLHMLFLPSTNHFLTIDFEKRCWTFRHVTRGCKARRNF